MKTDPTVTIVLDYPLQLADRILTEIPMRRPTLKEQRDFRVDGKQPLDVEINLYCRLTGLKPEEMNLLDLEDYEKLPTQYNRFREKPDSAGEQNTGPDPV